MTIPNSDLFFSGFTPDSIRFLQELKVNNNKAWFELNRKRFREVLQEPFQNLVKDLIPNMLAIDPLYEVEPIKKNISRINRDIRFPKDKSPYRPNMWLSFKRLTTDWKQDPVYFFEVMHDRYRYGMGFSKPTKAVLNVLRNLIESKPQRIHDMNQFISPNTEFNLMGDVYKRSVGVSTLLKPELATWYIRKDLFVMATRPIDSLLYDPKLVTHIITEFNRIFPLYTFFWELKDLAGEVGNPK